MGLGEGERLLDRPGPARMQAGAGYSHCSRQLELSSASCLHWGAPGKQPSLPDLLLVLQSPPLLKEKAAATFWSFFFVFFNQVSQKT